MRRLRARWAWRLPWGYIIYAVILILLFVASILLAPKPEIEDARPGGLGDFQFPTATEDRALPIVWGTTRIKAPNVIWYGDLRVVAIKETVKTGMFSSKSVTIGHTYYVGMDMALCHGLLDELHEIEVDDRVLFTGPVSTSSNGGTTIAIDQRTFFGKKGEGGGIVGDLQFYAGTLNQTADSYLLGVLGGATVVPGYVQVSHLVWRQGTLGESTQIKPWVFVVSRYPDNLALASNHHKINGDGGRFDANPAEVLYEILTDSVWGLGIDPAEIDLAAFAAAGETLFTEGNGFSLHTDVKRKGEEVMGEVLRQIDGAMYYDQEGKITLKLVRDDFTFGSLPVFDESNVVSLDNFTRGSWSETANDVTLAFFDRTDDFKPTGAMGQDTANFFIQGEKVAVEMRFPGVKFPATARRLATKFLRSQSYPAAVATITVNREGQDLRPGDALRFSWELLGITDMVMRVVTVNQGELLDGRITFKVVEDIFRVGEAIFETPPPTGWTPVNDNAVAATNEAAIEMPYWFILTDELLQGDHEHVTATTNTGERILSMVEASSDSMLDWSLVIQTDATELGRSSGRTPTGLLQGAYAEDTADIDATGFTIDGTVDVVVGGPDPTLAPATAADVQQFGLNMAVIDPDTATEEFIAFEGITDNLDGSFDLTNVHRGMLDTLPRAHADNAKVYFFRNYNAVSNVGFGGTASVTVEHLTRTQTDYLESASATNIPITFDERVRRPLPVGQAEFNGFRYPGPTDIPDAADLTITWAHRNRFDPAALDQNDADSALGRDDEYGATGVEYFIDVWVLPAVTLIASFGPLTGTSQLYTRAQQFIDNGGANPQELRVRIRATDGDLSLDNRHDVVRDFDYSA